VKVTTHLYLVPRLRRYGARSPLFHMPSWHAQGQVHLYFHKLFLMVVLIILDPVKGDMTVAKFESTTVLNF
jgi:hypothetical protein